MPSSSQALDRIDVTFDHDQAVADAGLILPATCATQLGLEETADALVGVGYRPGRKVATVVHGILAGGDCIDDVDVLRARVVAAPTADAGQPSVRGPQEARRDYPAGSAACRGTSPEVARRFTLVS